MNGALHYQKNMKQYKKLCSVMFFVTKANSD